MAKKSRAASKAKSKAPKAKRAGKKGLSRESRALRAESKSSAKPRRSTASRQDVERVVPRMQRQTRP